MSQRLDNIAALIDREEAANAAYVTGQMNRDTWTGYGSSAQYRSSGYTSIYQSMMQQIFTDFGFGSYPGSTETIGQNVGATS